MGLLRWNLRGTDVLSRAVGSFADRLKPIACRPAPTSLLERSLLKRVRDTRQGCRESLTPGAGSGQAQEAIGLALLTTPVRAATMFEVIVPLASK
jgi:hypothetical protein